MGSRSHAPPGPCDASATALHDTAATVAIAASAARDIEWRIRYEVMTISRNKTLQRYERNLAPVLRGCANLNGIRVHVHDAIIQTAFTSLASVCELRRGDADCSART